MARLKQIWVYLRSSLWFIPAVAVIALIALALELIDVDRRIDPELAARWPKFFASSPEGAQAMLAAIATAMMTVTGVVFSITIVALSQASSQYSPRVLRNFMRDRSNQIVLGFFVGIFAYCLVVLRSITREAQGASVPMLGVFCGFIFALLGMGLLIYFIHHIALSLQASNMIQTITTETLGVIAKLFPKPAKPEGAREDHGKTCEEALDEKNWHPVPGSAFGYVQQVNMEGLIDIACSRGTTLRMEVGIGEFALRDHPLLYVCGDRQPDKTLIQKINACYAVDSNRTVDQDPGFGIRQLVDIAVKSLSPGINDTTTAVTAVNYLSQILCDIAGRQLEPKHHFRGSELRIITRGLTFEKLLGDAFQQIVENSGGNMAVTMNLLESLDRIADSTDIPNRRCAVRRELESVTELVRHIQPAQARRIARDYALQVRRGMSAG